MSEVAAVEPERWENFRLLSFVPLPVIWEVTTDDRLVVVVERVRL